VRTFCHTDAIVTLMSFLPASVYEVFASATAPLFQRAVASFRNGRLAETEALCTEILRARPRDFDAVHLLGLVALQGGETNRSIELLEHSVTLDPRHPVARMNLANALLQAGRAAEALDSSDAALALRPDYPEALNSRGNALLQLRRPGEALASYDRALQARPESAALYCNRGNVLRELGRPAEALESYQRALRLQPGFPDALLGSAGVLADLGHYEEALSDLDRLLARQPQSVSLLLDRGNALFHLDRVEEALDCYRRALELAPDNAGALFNRGNALLRLQKPEEALASYEAAAALEPQLARAHYGRGNALRRLLRRDDALSSYARALAVDPASVGALIGIGNTYRDMDRLSEALVQYDRALELAPHNLEALNARARALLGLNRPQDAVESLERLLAADPRKGPEYSGALGVLQHARLLSCDWGDFTATTAAIDLGISEGKRVTHPALYGAFGESPELHLRCTRAFVQDKWGRVRASSWTGTTSRHDRIRLAYVSTDFLQHPVAALLAGIFETHDRERFEPIAISLRPDDGSALGRRVRGAFEHFIDVTSRTDAEVVALMRELEVDIAVDLTGFTSNFRTGIFARRAAPVQVNYLGYAGTLADTCIDYLIADPVVIPDPDRTCYGESVVYLPHCYLPPGDRRGPGAHIPTRVDCGLPEHGFVFCNFNAHYKLVPWMFDAWMRILRAVPDSVLWLAEGPPGVTRNLTREAASRGIDPTRLVFAPRLANLEDHLARCQRADLFLDTLPYNAHATAMDALWAGLPVLTCRGKTFPGRAGASMLTTLAFPELITESLPEYESRAIALTTGSELTQLRSRLQRSRGAHPFFDADRFRQHLEAAYVAMWQRFQRGTPRPRVSTGP
jgi:protein O-GlcNAc transferase